MCGCGIRCATNRTGVREVRDAFGVEPRALIDIQALMGDSIDNIKGVPGVGEKTAAALIQEFGSLDNLYANLARVEESKKLRGAKKVAALLAEHRDDGDAGAQAGDDRLRGAARSRPGGFRVAGYR